MSQKKMKKTSRKAKQVTYTEEALKSALEAIRGKKGSIRKICSDYGVPKTTVIDRIKGKTTDEIKKRGPDPILGLVGEKMIVDWVKDISECGFLIRKREILSAMQKVLIDSKNLSKLQNKCPGQTWYLNFLKRNPEISNRSIICNNNVNALAVEDAIKHWFKQLENFLFKKKQNIVLNSPKRIFSIFECGFSVCPKTGVILGIKNFRHNYRNNNENKNLSVLLIFNANGQICPPFIVYPYNQKPSDLSDKWCLGKSETGLLNERTFYEYLTRDFNNWIEFNKIKKPVLVLVDGRKTLMSMMLSSACTEKQIILYSFFPNSANILHPGFSRILASFATNWDKTEHTVTVEAFFNMFDKLLIDINIDEKIKNDFSYCGIYPFDVNKAVTSATKFEIEDISRSDFDGYNSQEIVADSHIKTIDPINISNKSFINKQEKSSKKKQAKINSLTKITKSDIVSTEKVLRYLQPKLHFDVKLVFKELSKLNKSLPFVKRMNTDLNKGHTSKIFHLSNAQLDTLIPDLEPNF